MSFAKVYSAQVSCLRAQIIDIEVDLSNGLHSFSIVGLGDKSVEESKDRVSAAIKNSGFKSPKVKNQKVIISLAPADLKKEGPLFDVGMALGYLLAAEEIDFNPKNKLFLGELSLDGELRGVTGVLPLIKHAKEKGFTEIFLPKENAREAALIEGIDIYAASHIREMIEHLDEKRIKDKNSYIRPEPQTKILGSSANSIDFSEIKGQETAKRGLVIAAAGCHNVLMFGPPGTGKTMLAKAFPSLLPQLSFDEVLEVTGIHSIAGILKADLVTHPPFRAPHHTASYAALIGGSNNPKPGEITLAHKGVLFLDEFPEFDRRVIDSLREPLEERSITISRSKASVEFPAHFILLAAMNPCPCGNFGIENKECICPPQNVLRYQQKISGPIMDRIDICIEVSKTDHQELTTQTDTKLTNSMKQSVVEARTIQQKRYAGTSIKTNSEIKSKDIERYMHLKPEVKNILNKAARQLELSARAYFRLIKLARTIADLANKEHIEIEHMLEALQYRPKRSVF